MTTADTALQRLLLGLPTYFNVDPKAVAGIAIVYSGGSSAVATVHHRQLTTIVNGTGPNITYNLRNYTLSSLVSAINTNSGYTATLVGNGSTSALALVEVSNISITNTTNLQVFTSILWTVLAPIAWAFEDAGITQDLLELVIETTDGHWVDTWGWLYGFITRNPNETDLAFQQRIMDEAVRLRLNGKSIVQIVAQLTGQVIDIGSGQADIVDVIGKSRIGQAILPDRQHARNQFEVYGVNATTPQVQAVINRNRAAGENPQYTYTSPILFSAFISPTMPIIAPWPSS